MQKHNNDDEFFGINKKLYKKSPKDEFTFKSISDNVFLPTQPELNAPNDNYQTVHLPKHNILQQSLRRQVQSIVYAQTFINQIVYDSKDSSPYTKDLDPSSYQMDMLPYYIPKSNRVLNAVTYAESFKSKNRYKKVFVLVQFGIGDRFWYQWAHTMVFFSVANTRKNVQYRFNIINLLKPDSLYNVGMKPLIYSQKNALSKNIGWIRIGRYSVNLKSFIEQVIFQRISISYQKIMNLRLGKEVKNISKALDSANHSQLQLKKYENSSKILLFTLFLQCCF